jgi:hypothetical protein
MATPDSGIKKVTIPEADLPDLLPGLTKYVVRFRFVSDDKNRTSHWSPSQEVDPSNPA